MKRYEKLAAGIADSIDDGTLAAGMRLPSVRKVSTERGVSMSTVFQAYYLLEARGLIRAKDRSGYYVLPRVRLPPEPSISLPPAGRTKVDVSELVFQVLQSTRRREVVPLGSAFPSPHLFPLAKLGLALARAARAPEPWRAVDDIAPGNPELRRQIAIRYVADDVRVGADDIVITNGALEALNLCLTAVTRPGDTVIVESPCFYGALQALERLDLRAALVPTDPREGIDLAALDRVIRKEKPRACWMMTTFQNPLGSTMPQEKKRDLVALLTRHGVPLIEDDVYGELYLGKSRLPPAKTYDTAGLVMHCSSFSKSLAPGYRIGWAAPGRFFDAVLRLKLSTSISSPVPIQSALASYLERGGYDRHLRHLREALVTRQHHMMRAISRYFPKGTRATRPLGGYFVWVELPEAVDALEIHRQALVAGVSVAPGPIFSAQRSFRNCLRLNYGYPWEPAVEKAMATLGRLCSKMVG